MKKKISRSIGLLLLLAAGMLTLSGCSRENNAHTRGVYMLLDTSGTYTQELQKAQGIINYLLGSLQPGESFAVARIDSGSFSEKDIIQNITFDTRPSVATNQKRIFAQKIDEFVKNVKGSPYTDISGGMLQAVEWLNETGSGKKTILIFSDMEEELAKGYVRDFPIPLKGFQGGGPECHQAARRHHRSARLPGSSGPVAGQGGKRRRSMAGDQRPGKAGADPLRLTANPDPLKTKKWGA